MHAISSQLNNYLVKFFLSFTKNEWTLLAAGVEIQEIIASSIPMCTCSLSHTTFLANCQLY